MKSFFTVIVLALSLNTTAQDEALLQDPITKPVFSIRCKELFKERSEKIKIQQKLNSLLLRNGELIRKSPKEKEGLKARLQSNQIKIKNELYLTNLNIGTIEENIVRSGCPGLAL